MGGSKLDRALGGSTVLGATLGAVGQAGLPVLLVTGAHAEAVRAAAPGVPAVHADRHAEGMAESLKAGLAAMPGDWEGFLVVLGDMPFVRAGTLRRLAEALAAGADAVAPAFEGRRGNPAGFRRALVPQLMALAGDAGARGWPVVLVAVDDPGVLRDIDRQSDLPGRGGTNRN
jgi:molybdenum cofactor cytidylyltransferase